MLVRRAAVLRGASTAAVGNMRLKAGEGATRAAVVALKVVAGSATCKVQGVLLTSGSKPVQKEQIPKRVQHAQKDLLLKEAKKEREEWKQARSRCRAGRVIGGGGGGRSLCSDCILSSTLLLAGKHAKQGPKQWGCLHFSSPCASAKGEVCWLWHTIT